MPKVKHLCHARGCDTVVRPEMLMCRKHWNLVPQVLKSDVWGTYVDGQCYDRTLVSEEYLEAAQAAVDAVAEAEGL